MKPHPTILLCTGIAALLITSASLNASEIVIFEEDFNTYSEGSLVGQGGWQLHAGSNTGPSIYQNLAGTDGTSIAGPAPEGSTGLIAAQRILSGGFQLTSGDIVTIEYDVLRVGSAANIPGFGIGAGNVTPALLSTRVDGAVEVRGENNGTQHAVLNANGTTFTRTEGELYRLRTVWDLASNGGAGSATVYYRNITQNDLAFTQLYFSDGAGGVQESVSLQISTNPDTWTRGWLRSGSGEQFTYVDNIVVSALKGEPLVTVVHYGFDETSTRFEPGPVGDHVTAGLFSGGAGVTSMPTGTSVVAQSGRSLYFNNAGFHSGTEEISIEYERYLYFTVGIEQGYEADFTGISFYTLRRALDDEGLGAPQAFSVYSSADDYSTQLGAGPMPLAGDNTFSGQWIEFDEYPFLQGVSGEVTFRLVFWTPDGIAGSNQRAWRLDELSLQGVIKEAALGESFDQWRELHFSPTELDDSEFSGPGAMPMGDGVPNLLKYAMGLLPKEVADRALLPSMEPADGYITLSFRRAKDRPDVELIVEVSEDLVTWNTGVSVVEQMNVEDEGDVEIITVRLLPAMDQAPRLFGRILAELVE